MNKLLQNINNFSLLLFVFGVNFEYWDPLGLQGVFSIAKMTAIVYIASWVPFLNKIKLKPLKPFLVPLVLYMLVEFFSSAINSIYASNILGTFNFKLIQLLILLVLIVSHIYHNNVLLKWVLYSFIANVLLLSILSALGIGYEVVEAQDGGRLEMFGENPNMIGMKASFAAIMLFYFIFNTKKLWFKTLLVLPLLFIISMLIATASRGALLSIFVGLGIMVMIQKTKALRKIVLFSIGIAVSIWLFNNIMTTNENFAMRMNLFIEEGNTGRNDLWEGAYSVIMDNLVIGVGKPGALHVMQQYIGRAIDPHNVFLYVLMTTGIIGFLFFMTFISRLATRLFKDFKQTNNAMYLVLFAILLFNMSKAGGFINKTFLWFFFAVLVGSTFINKTSYNTFQK